MIKIFYVVLYPDTMSMHSENFVRRVFLLGCVCYPWTSYKNQLSLIQTWQPAGVANRKSDAVHAAGRVDCRQGGS